MTARPRRLRRRGQAGVTLIETVVTVGIVSASIVTLVAALATAEQTAGTNSQQAHVQVALRTLADDLRDNSAVPYNRCTVNGTVYRNTLNAPPLQLSGVTVTSVAVERPAVPNSGVQLKGSKCGSRQDYGVQRLTLNIRQGSTNGSVIVWKQQSVSATAAPTLTPSPTP